MGKLKSFLQNITVDEAAKTHQCQHNNRHTVNKGDRRLKLKVGRSNEHFCVQCAIESIDRDIATLENLKRQLTQ